MSQELLFILFIFIPLVIFSISLVITQRRFFDRYSRVFHPKDPISVVDLKRIYIKNPSEAYTFLKKSGLKFIFLRWKLFLQKYDDPQLNRYALKVRIVIAISFSLIVTGILVLLLIDLNNTIS